MADRHVITVPGETTLDDFFGLLASAPGDVSAEKSQVTCVFYGDSFEEHVGSLPRSGAVRTWAPHELASALFFSYRREAPESPVPADAATHPRQVITLGWIDPIEAGSAGKTGKAPSPALLAHASETFGSEAAAWEWLKMTCGAMQNRSPWDLIQQDNEGEVDRILHCIDHGMIA